MISLIYKKILIKVLSKRTNSIISSSDIPLHVLKNNIGNNCNINKEVSIYKNDVVIGDNTYINGGKIFYAKIGKFCSVGYNVSIGSGEHYIDKVSTFPLKNKIGGIQGLIDFPEQKHSIVCNDVWIGNNVIIKQGVTIGNGAIIASGAVVTKNVEPYSIVGGVPAKLIRMRFDNDIILKLQSIEWWNWDNKKLKESILNNEFDNIINFTNKYYQTK